MKPLNQILAEQHLNFSFNLLPSLKDLASIVKKLRAFDKAWKTLLENANKVRVSHARFPVHKDPPAKDTIVFNSYEKTDQAYRWIEPPVFCGTLKYVYSLPAIGNTSKLGALLDSIGINLNPEILWEAVPFSFVIDWFFRVGDYLSTFKLDNIRPDVRILEITYSLKHTCRYTKNAFIGLESKDFLLHMGTRIWYDRWVGHPPVDQIEEGSFGWRQALLSASLGRVLFGPRSR
jgi:hypothetical protein